MKREECRDYDEMIAHLALSRIELDLDDGVKVNYEKIQTASDGKKYAVRSVRPAKNFGIRSPWQAAGLADNMRPF